MYDDNRPVTVSAEPHADPNIRQLARACIAIAKSRINQQRITEALYQLEPNLVLGERHDRDAALLNGQPFVIFDGDSVACHLDGKCADQLIRQGKAAVWYLPGELIPREGWIKFLPHVPEKEVIHWLKCALVQMGVGSAV